MKFSQGIDLAATGNKTIKLELNRGAVKKSDRGSEHGATYSVSSKHLTYRTMELPFNDKKKAKETVATTLEYSLAFPIEQCNWDLMMTGDGSAFIAIALKKDLPQQQKHTFLDSDVASLYRTAQYCNLKNLLIIDFGASKTLFIHIGENTLDRVKCIHTGGDALTNLIAKKESVSEQIAEELKIQKGTELKYVREQLGQLLSTAELELTEKDSILITGGGAQMKGLKEFIHDGFKKEITTFNLPSGISPYTDAVAFGAALRELYPNSSTSLGKEEKAEGFASLKWLLILLIPLLLFPTHLLLKSIYLELQCKGYENAINTHITHAIPSIKRVRAPRSQLQMAIALKKRASTQSSQSLLEKLKKIADASKGDGVTIYGIEYTSTQIDLSGEASNFNDVDQFKKQLSSDFKDVKVEIKTLPSKKIGFSLHMSAGGSR